VRYFRIPNFTGIENHREDNDRGTLTLSQNCLAFPPGGLRSAPVWKEIGSLPILPEDLATNTVYWAKDHNGNILHVVARGSLFHDLNLRSSGNPITNIDEFQVLKDSTGRLADLSMLERNAYFSDIGDNQLALSDGSPTLMGNPRGPAIIKEGVAGLPVLDSSFYSLEQANFPSCRFFVVGPNHTIFASGNPDKPLTIYLSEPAGAVAKEKRGIFTEEILSKVDLLLSGATEITSLSCSAGNVLVHTDSGVYLLKPPTGDQAFTGYRTEQVTTSPLSGAFNFKTSVGSQDSLPYYLGCDGQVYKATGVTKGPENHPANTDEDQASWKSKGEWEHEHPLGKEGAFAAYNAETGLYLLYMPTKEYEKYSNYAELIEQGTAECEAVEESGLLPTPPIGLRGITTPMAPFYLKGTVAPPAPVWDEENSYQLLNRPFFLRGLSTPPAPTLKGVIPYPPFNLSYIITPPAPDSLRSAQRPAKPTDLRFLPIPAQPTDLEGTTANPPAATNLRGLPTVPAPTLLRETQIPSMPTSLEGESSPATPTDLSQLLIPAAATNLSGESTVASPTGLSGASSPATPTNLESGVAIPNTPWNLAGASSPATPWNLMSTPGIPMGLRGLSSPATPFDLSGEVQLRWEDYCPGLHKFMDPFMGGTHQLWVTRIIDLGYESDGPIEIDYEANFGFKWADQTGNAAYIGDGDRHVYREEADATKIVKGYTNYTGIMPSSGQIDRLRQAVLLDSRIGTSSFGTFLSSGFIISLNYVGFYELGKPWKAQNPVGGLTFENVGPLDDAADANGDRWRRVFRLVPDEYGRYGIEHFLETDKREQELLYSNGSSQYKIKDYHYAVYASTVASCLTDIPCAAASMVYGSTARPVTKRDVLHGSSGKYLSVTATGGEPSWAYLVHPVPFGDKDGDPSQSASSLAMKKPKLPDCWMTRTPGNPQDPTPDPDPDPDPDPGGPSPDPPGPCTTTTISSFYKKDAVEEFGGGLLAMFTAWFPEMGGGGTYARTPYYKWGSVGGTGSRRHPNFEPNQFVDSRYNQGGSAPWQTYWGLVGMRYVKGIDLTNAWSGNPATTQGLLGRPYVNAMPGDGPNDAWYFDVNAWGRYGTNSIRYALVADEDGYYRFIEINYIGQKLTFNGVTQTEEARRWTALSHHRNNTKGVGTRQKCRPENAYYKGLPIFAETGNDIALLTVGNSQSYIRDLYGSGFNYKNFVLPQF
jgi:hypothetical protein